MSVSKSYNDNKCTSCQVCAAVCPKDAISIRLDDCGFYRPFVNVDKCVECGLCEQVCYRFQHNTEAVNLEGSLNYAAAAKDDELVAQTTSGGIADIMCEELIAQGYKCVGVAYDTESDNAIGLMAETRAQTIPFRGSKYIQSYSYPIFKKILNNYKKDKVAVFGTPCQIYGINLYLNKIKKRDNFILIDLYCHGCPSMNLWKKYIREAKKKASVNCFDKVTFRSKVHGWGNYIVTGVKGNKLQFVSSNAYNDPFFTLFFSDHVLNEACADCTIRGTVAHCDIRLGDFWGKKYILNTRGMSLVTIATQKGLALFEKITQKISFTKHEMEDFIQYQSCGKTYRINSGLREQLLCSLSNENLRLSETVKIYNNSLPLKLKQKKFLKNLILQMPTPLISFFKNLYYHIK